jgi:hypothetical protein
MEKKENRRKSKRHPAHWKVAMIFQSPDGKPVILHSHTLDLSMGGAAVVSEARVETGSVITVLLAHPEKNDRDGPKIVKKRARIVSSRKASPGSGFHLGLSFMSLSEDDVAALAEMLQKLESRQPPERESRASPTAGGRLARLKELAQKTEAQEKPPDRDAIQTQVGETLERTYLFLKDLVEQLNRVHLAYEKGYMIIGVPDFTGLKWESGRADFHTRDLSPGRKVYERIGVNFRLSGNKKIHVTVKNPTNERLKKTLTENRIEFTAREIANHRGHIESSAFSFPCEVKGNIFLQGDFDTGQILLRTINVERFGTLEYRINPEAITPEALDEFAGFIMGEEREIKLLLTPP